MATLKPTAPLPRLLRAIRPQYYNHNHQQRRTFLPNPFSALPNPPSSPQRLSATRTLPYPPAPIYSIIADVPNYSTFLPYCQHSSVTKWSLPDARYGRRWPSEGLLTSGFGGITESFVSRIYCVPGRYVESVGGDAETTLNGDEIRHHVEGEDRAGQRSRDRRGNGLLTHLKSKWEVQGVQVGSEARTRVSLTVEFSFANPMYAALSGGVAPKVAEYMVKAFEQRVQELLERNPGMVKADLADLDGSALRRK
ncbi:uncharacterized protein yc1106_06988 [Curvularia clavata]|uniref:Coenzyme Q-binding protein COQ10 START domain-containing protein n=1 Tax=Curvularia clavata TaxID=95742 RepID=A0A9Q8ZDY5_CURCL|nr:uncharacterized protein yc1106_06988 [Curvularia clavata]